MITVISRFPLPAGLDVETLTAKFVDSVPRYQAVPGLDRKYYYRTEDNHGGGVYLFRDRASAEAFFTDDFVRDLETRYGQPVTVTWLPTLVTLDTADGTVRRVWPAEV